MIQRRARRVFSPSLAFKVSPSRVVVPGSSSRAFSSAKRARDHRDTMVSSPSSAHARASLARPRTRGGGHANVHASRRALVEARERSSERRDARARRAREC